MTSYLGLAAFFATLLSQRSKRNATNSHYGQLKTTQVQEEAIRWTSTAGNLLVWPPPVPHEAWLPAAPCRP